MPAQLNWVLDLDVRGFFVHAFQLRMDRTEHGEEMLRAVLPQVLVQADLREQLCTNYTLPTAHLLEGFVAAKVEQGELQQVDVALAVRVVQAIFVGMLVLRILGEVQLRDQWAQVPESVASLVFEGLSPRRKV